MEKYQSLFESVFKKDPAGTDTVGFLEKITGEYPYFPVAQFYLLQSLKKESPQYKKQVKKTAAIFNNNYWLNFQLLEAGRPHTAIVDQQKFSLEENDMVSLKDTEIDPGEAIIAADNDSVPPPHIEPISGIPEHNILPSIEITKDTESNIATPIAGQSAVLPVVALERSPDEPGVMVPDEMNVPEEEQLNAGAVLQEEDFPATDQPAQDESNAENETAEEPVKEAASTEEPVVALTETSDEKIEAAIDTPMETGVSTDEQENVLPAFQRSIEPIVTDIRDDAPLFEPLHTTDYFASVGIKLSEEAKPEDKLGKQLKSFTEWLKTMKKIHTEQLIKASSPDEIEANNTESNIQQLAEKSNVDDEVVTEAMAEVLLQQGRKNKAIEVLQKLSLLDPGKSAYFAAKINQIKEP